MPRVVALILLMLAGVGSVVPAYAQVDLLLGDWRQIASSAGDCPSCQITLGRGGGAVTVTANNGWSARVAEQARPGVIAAHGNGRWGARDHRLDGRPVEIDLELRGDRLYMTMRVNGGPRAFTVRAVYGRAWLGS